MRSALRLPMLGNRESAVTNSLNIFGKLIFQIADSRWQLSRYDLSAIWHLPSA
jgi:hypothetical protein